MKSIAKFGLLATLATSLSLFIGVHSASASPVGGTLTVNTSIGTGVQLWANTPNQKITVSLSTPTTQIQAEDINAQINSGTSGPILDSADFGTGTIFASNNNFGATAEDQAVINTPESGIPSNMANYLIIEATTTSGGTVNPNGLVVTLTVDTTGMVAGNTFLVNLLSTANQTSDFVITGAPTLTTITPLAYASSGNTITLIGTPEPASMGVLACAGALLIKRRRRMA